MALDLAVAQAQPNTGESEGQRGWTGECGSHVVVAFVCAVLMEELHRTAFRDQLSNSIFCQSHNLPKLTHEDVSYPSTVCCGGASVGVLTGCLCLTTAE